MNFPPYCLYGHWQPKYADFIVIEAWREILSTERLSCAHRFPANTQAIRWEVQRMSSCFELPFWLINFLWHFPPLCLGVHWRESSCKTQDWFHGSEENADSVRKEREGGNMSHIYVMLVTPAIRHTGSLCSYCLLSADEYALSEFGELSKICLWSPLEDLVPSQPLCCLLNFPHLWTLYTEHTWALFVVSISALKGYSWIMNCISFLWLCIVNAHYMNDRSMCLYTSAAGNTKSSWFHQEQMK